SLEEGVEGVLTREPFEQVVVTEDVLEEILGPVRYESEGATRVSVPGVVTGLAWKTTGGELLFIECSLVQGGRGTLTITGKLGEVMKESAAIALSWLKSKLP
ncbi:atp-dependent protease la, partial [Nannochloropsis gaditana CCMP526]|uniref:atp-dependent protease la n=1 Tax=Nannochloropsis gaditana (strain CCMP526) TaxID=1093141 RepID=UPI00029F4F53